MTMSLGATLSAIARGHHIPPEKLNVLCKRGLIAMRRQGPFVTAEGLRRLGLKSEDRPAREQRPR